MTFRRSVIRGLAFVVAAGMGGLGQRHARAASNAPTVSIHRNPTFVGRVSVGDFNGDGIPDLAGSSRDPANPTGPVLLTVALGKGDGTFGAPIRMNRFGTVFAVGDFNHDGKLDLLEQFLDTDEELLVLAGNGDGTFSAGGIVTTTNHTLFAMAADLDGDGNLDVVVACINETAGEPQHQIVLVRGNGDLTFDSLHATVVAAMPDPMSGTIADLDGDGRKDIAIANHEEQSLTVLRNQGSMMFAATELALPHAANDVAAADVNGDGRIDLVVASSDGGTDGFREGFASVLIGNGTGTFATPVDYPTAPGTWRIAVGDFTRDGVLDIATANRSSINRDDCGWPWKTWDTLSILPGSANGTFGTPSNFSIGDQRRVDDQLTDRNQVVSLTASDLNGDQTADLLLSNATVFINKAADPNWAPTVSAGADATLDASEDEFILRAVANDVDQDMLTYSWTASDGIGIQPVPDPCIGIFGNGPHTYTVTVDDGHGHRASDSVTYTVSGPAPPTINVTAPAAGEVVPAGEPYLVRWTATPGAAPIQRFDLSFSSDGFSRFAIPECSNLAATATSCQWNNPTVTEQGRIVVTAQDANGGASQASGLFAVRSTTTSGLPPGWSHGDIGNVGAAGTSGYDSGIYRLEGSGADIWGTADEFQYAYVDHNATGSREGVEVIAHVDSVQNVNAWTKAGVMIRQSLNPSAPQASVFVSPSKGVAFQRRLAQGGSSVSTAAPAITAPVWLRITAQGSSSGEVVHGYFKKNAGDPWTSIGQDASTTAWNQPVSGLAVSSHADGTLATGVFSSVSAGFIPEWTTTVISPYPGSASVNGDVATLQGRGTDIWNAADQFTYMWDKCPGDCTITARVNSLQNTNAWSKAGVMFRETLTGASKQADMIVSPSKGAAMQYRATTGGGSAQGGTHTGAAPAWVRISRVGNVFTGYWSTDGVAFTAVGRATVSLPPFVMVGLAVTSHDPAASATALFDNIVIQQP